MQRATTSGGYSYYGWNQKNKNTEAVWGPAENSSTTEGSFSAVFSPAVLDSMVSIRCRLFSVFRKKKLGYVAVFSGNSEPLGGLVSSGKKTFGVGATRHPDWSCFWIHND